MIKLENNLELERCPHCNVDNPNLQMKHSFNTESHNHLFSRHWGVYVCSRCGGAILAWARTGSNFVEETHPKNKKIPASLPAKAQEYLLQATNSLHSPAGAIMLSASSIDAMLKSSGYSEGSLHDRINKASVDHLITNEMARWAHQVRLEANGQRHADEEEELPTIEEAQDVLDFTNALAEFLFELPEKVNSGLNKTSDEK